MKCPYCDKTIPLALRKTGLCAHCRQVEIKRTQRKIMIAACPRSGTTFVSKALKGLLIGHEQVDTHGTSSWMIIEDDPALYSQGHHGERRGDYDWALIVHLVREPLACIGSMTTMHPEFFSTVEAVCGNLVWETEIERAAHAWLLWNARIEKEAHLRVRVEDIHDRGFGKRVNTRVHKELEWGELERHEEAVRMMGLRYGYY